LIEKELEDEINLGSAVIVIFGAWGLGGDLSRPRVPQNRRKTAKPAKRPADKLGTVHEPVGIGNGVARKINNLQKCLDL
jgi:hypothetical protein